MVVTYQHLSGDWENTDKVPDNIQKLADEVIEMDSVMSDSLIAVMENYYDPVNECVIVPDVLKPYMGGITKISPVNYEGQDIKSATG